MPPHAHGEPYTMQESVELARLRREGIDVPQAVSMEKMRAFLAEHRKRWRAKGNMPWPDPPKA